MNLEVDYLLQVEVTEHGHEYRVIRIDDNLSNFTPVGVLKPINRSNQVLNLKTRLIYFH